MVRYQLIMSINAVNAITPHAISVTLFGTLVIFGTPQYHLWPARQGPQMRYCLRAPECVETPLITRGVRGQLSQKKHYVTLERPQCYNTTYRRRRHGTCSWMRGSSCYWTSPEALPFVAPSDYVTTTQGINYAGRQTEKLIQYNTETSMSPKSPRKPSSTAC